MRPLDMVMIMGLLVLAVGVKADKALLVENGKAAASIVLAAQPTRAAQFAAAELQWHLEQITGATVPMVADDQPVSGTRILVGESEATIALGLRNTDFEPQEYLVRVRPGLIVLMGRDKDDRREFSYDKVDTWPELFDEQASAYAVYDFLEKFCDVRWYIPTELGLSCPHRRTLTVSGPEVRRAPVMKTRGQSVAYQFPADLCGDTMKTEQPSPVLAWREQMLWWHRMRLGGEAYAGNHSLYGYYDRFLEEHPEYFSQGGQGRPTQMCYTNEGLIRQVIQDAEDYFEGKGLKPGGVGAGDYFAVVPMDNSAWCKCPNCAPVLPTGPTRGKGQFSNDSASNYLFGFVNRVAKPLADKYPDKYIAALAYSSYAWPPTSEKLAPNVSIQMCLHARMIYNPSVQDNDWEIVQAWVDESPERRKLLWLYYCFPSLSATSGQFRCFPGFFGHTVVKYMARYHAAGIRGLYYEPSYLYGSRRSALLDQVESLVTWKLADDPTVDGNAYIDEFFTRYYGHAAEPMKKFYERVEQIYADPANYPKNQGHQNEEIAWGYLGTAERMAELGQLMEQAKQSVRSSLERKRVELFEKGIWQYMQAGRATYEQHAALKASANQKAQAPRLAAVPEGDLNQVDWEKAGVLGNWRSLYAEPTEREVEGRIAHDGTYLYLQLEEKLDTKTLVITDNNVWGEDDWEIFIAKQQGQPYRQMGVNAKGTHIDLAWGEEEKEWDSGAKVISDYSAPNRWTTRIAFPLVKLAPGGVKPGEKIYLNIIRSTKMTNTLAWIPTFGGFHAPEQLGEIALAE